jgi:hypothetical protein
MKSSVFNAQITTLRYCSVSCLAGLNLNIFVNTREYFRLTYFWAPLYNQRNLLLLIEVVKYNILSLMKLFEMERLYSLSTKKKLKFIMEVI